MTRLMCFEITDNRNETEIDTPSMKKVKTLQLFGFVVGVCVCVLRVPGMRMVWYGMACVLCVLCVVLCVSVSVLQ